MNKEVPKPRTFYIDSALYQRLEINQENVAEYFKLLFFSGTIDCYCVQCKSDSIFQLVLMPSEREAPRQADAEWKRLMVLSKYVGDLEPVGRGVPSKSRSPTRFDVYKLPSGVVVRNLACMRKDAHTIQVIFYAKDNSLIKIGQFPSSADIALPTESRFRKILGPLYPELHRAIGLHAHGIGIGAFVYLRRIFESLVEAAHSEVAATETWSEDQESAYRTARMAERISALKGSLPAFLVENAALYGILSTGIHELKEDECLAYFEVVKSGIELILDEKASAEEKRSRAAEAGQSITALRERLAKKGESA